MQLGQHLFLVGPMTEVDRKAALGCDALGDQPSFNFDIFGRVLAAGLTCDASEVAAALDEEGLMQKPDAGCKAAWILHQLLCETLA